MTMREATIAAACLLAVLLCSEAHSQTAQATASSDQSQGQSQQQVGGMGAASAASTQGQSQYTGGSQSNSSGGSVVDSANVIFSDSFNGAAPIRYLPVPTSVIVPTNGGPGYFGDPNYVDNGPDFVSMRQLVEAMNYVDLSLPLAAKVNMTVQMLGAVAARKVDKAKVAEKSAIKFEINDGKAVNHGFQPIAMITMEAQDAGELNSSTLALAAGKKAQALGASRVVFLTEGSSKELYSWGVGIGFSYNSASVDSKPSGSGSVGAGGTGWSYGKAGFDSLIYLSAIIGR